MVFSGVSIPFVILFGLYESVSLTLFALCSTFLLVLPLIVNYFRFYVLARYILMISLNLIILFFGTLLGREAGIQYMYFALVGICFMLFEPTYKRHIYFTIGLNMVGFLVLFGSDFSLFIVLFPFYIPYKTIVLFSSVATLVVCFFSMRFFFLMTVSYQEELQDSFESAQDQRLFI